MTALPPWEYTFRATRSDKPRKVGDDGDTVLLLVDRGMNDRTEEPIRLVDVWAPERKDFGGAEAAKLVDLVLNEVTERFTAKGLRWPFVLRTEKVRGSDEDVRRSFARWLGVLYARDTGACLNDEIIALIALHPEWSGGIGAKAARDNG